MEVDIPDLHLKMLIAWLSLESTISETLTEDNIIVSEVTTPNLHSCSMSYLKSFLTLYTLSN